MTAIQKYPKIYAQQEILKVLIEIIEKLEKPLNCYKEQRIIESYNLELETYNDGYEIRTNIKINLDCYQDNSKDELVGRLNNLTSIYLQPGSFYSSDLVKEHGARIEGCLPDEGHMFAKSFPRYTVHNNEDMENVVENFKNEVIKFIEQL